MSSSANPRKFSEKIALQQQKLVEQQREFDAVMREVEDATKKKGSPPLSDQYSDVGLEYTHMQGFQTSHFGGPLSLPDYSAAPSGNRGIDLADALRNLQSLTHQSPLSVEYNNDRVFTTRQSDTNPAFCKPHRFEHEMHQGLASPAMLGSQQNIAGNVISSLGMQSPNPFLPLPLESNWRRTHSDSSLHATVMGTNASTSAATGGSTTANVSQQMNPEGVGQDRRRQHLNSKTQSTEQYNNGYVPVVPYSLVSPMASLSVNKPPSLRSPGPVVHSPTGADVMCGGIGSDAITRYDPGSPLFHINGGTGTLEQQPSSLQQHSISNVPNHHQMMAGNTSYSALPPPHPHAMRSGNPITAMLGSADTSLLNTSSLPDLTVALARGSALPSGFPINDQFGEINNSRSPTSRVHKHRIPRAHARPSLLTQRNQHDPQHLMSYLGNGGRSASHADMVALTSCSPDNNPPGSSGGLLAIRNAQSISTHGLVGSGAMSPTIARYQPIPPQQFDRRFDRISMDQTSSFNYQSQQQQPLYQMYPEQGIPQQMVGLNQRIPEICIEAAEDQHHQQLLQQQQLNAVSPVVSAVAQQQEFSSSPHQQFSLPTSSSPMVDQNSSLYYESNIFDGNMVSSVVPIDMNSMLSDTSTTSSYGQQQQQPTQFYVSPLPSSSSMPGADQQQQTFQSWQS